MSNSTVDYLDAIRAKLEIHNDSALARALGVSRQTISSYRLKSVSMDDDVAARAAELLGVQPGTVLLDMYTERTRDPRIKSIWAQIGVAFLNNTPAPHQMGLALA
jgi:transcriptional regulator with XRE-family HTH domain